MFVRKQNVNVNVFVLVKIFLHICATANIPDLDFYTVINAKSSCGPAKDYQSNIERKQLHAPKYSQGKKLSTV